MLRTVLVIVLLSCSLLLAADPQSPIEKSLAIQQAIAQANTLLLANQPADAVAALEKVLTLVDGNTEFLGVLHEAYSTELKKQQVARTPDVKRIAELKNRLALLEKPNERRAHAPPPPAVVDMPKLDPPKIDSPKTDSPRVDPPKMNDGTDWVKVATELFQQAKTQPTKFNDAAKAFAKAVNNRVELSAEQQAAWAYCRVRLAVDAYNRSARESTVAASTIREIEDALQLAPSHPELQAFGRKIIRDLGGQPANSTLITTPTTSTTPPNTKPTIADVSWLALESDHFRIRFQGSADSSQATALLSKAEEYRRAIFAKWSGGPPNAWQPKCELMLHLSANEFAAATNQSPAATGHAFVKLDTKRVIERRIDLRADDESLTDDTLPRELAYVILADLFPHQAAPRWASIGIAVLSASNEAERCAKTLLRCQREGELLPLTKVFELSGPPKAEAITPYYVESVSVVEYLVRKKGEKAFRIFLQDAQRYGIANALQRQYGYESVRGFEDEWRRSLFTTARGQAP